MTWTIARKITYGFAFAFFIILSSGLALQYSAHLRASSDRWVRHTEEVIGQLSTSLRLMVDMETGSRGFALTGREEFLDPYTAADDRLPEVLARIERLTVDNPVQHARARKLQELIRERLHFATEVHDRRRTDGLEGAAAKVATGRGNTVMSSIRHLVQEMEAEEQRLLVERTAEDRAMERWIVFGQLGISVTGLLLVLAGAVLLSRAVTRPVARLVEGVERFSAGDLSFRIEPGADDEFGLLARAFNRMAHTRKEAEEGLKRANYLLDGIFRASPIAILSANKECRIDIWNPAAERMFGWKASEVLGLSLRELRLIDGSDEWAALSAADALKDGEIVDREREYGRKDGTEFDARVHFAPRIQEGRLEGIMATVEDITERKKAEQALAKAKDAAEAVSRELESFSYSVAHDLRAPLRSIAGFSQAVVEDCGDRLDEEGRSNLTRVRAAANRMGHLIDDLLALARVSRTEVHRERIDVTRIAREIAERLRQAEPARDIELRISEGMSAEADARLLAIALENLLGNAMKFTRNRSKARIEVGVSATSPVTYYVRDNGAGFDMSHAQRLFGAFQRLHSNKEFEGTGIGLATVQRIIRRHGGRIWAESAVDLGATFSFTL